MKQVLRMTFVVVSLMVMSHVNAQNLNKKSQDRITAEVKEMADVMDLKEDQQTKIIELKTNLLKANMKAGKEFEKGSQKLKDARKLNMQSYRESLKTVCSKDQLVKWQKYNKAKRN